MGSNEMPPRDALLISLFCERKRANAGIAIQDVVALQICRGKDGVRLA